MRTPNSSPRRKRVRRLAPLVPLLLAVTCATGRAAPEASNQASAKPPVKTHAQPASTKAAKTKRKSKKKKAVAPPSMGMQLGLRDTPDEYDLRSSAALVADLDTGEALAEKNADVVLPVASLTKLMTALVVVESGLPLKEVLEISREDIDTVKHTHSRLKVGTRLTRDEMLLLALMSSENRAAMALSRYYPGGREAFIARMNARAWELGMMHSHFADAAGLSGKSVSSAHDLFLLVKAADRHPIIREYSTQRSGVVKVKGGRLKFTNSNRLIQRQQPDWDIQLQKTGFTNEAGRCLVMQTTFQDRRLAMIFLDSTGTLTRYADAKRVRVHLEREFRNPAGAGVMAVTAAP